MTQQIINLSLRTSATSSRRTFLQGVASFGLAASVASPFLGHAADVRRGGKSMVFLWMDGGPSQYETFSPKPGSKYQGTTGAIRTQVPSISIAESWPRIAELMKEVAIIRSLTGVSGVHELAIPHVKTGYAFSPALTHPHFGSVVAREFEAASEELPAYVRIGKEPDSPQRTPGAGVLGVQFNPVKINEPGGLPPNVLPSVDNQRLERRLVLRRRLESDFAKQGPTATIAGRQGIYDRAGRFALSSRLSAFDLKREEAAVREAYGMNPFGQGCLLARRLVEQHVLFIEIVRTGWDTHRDDAFAQNAKLSREVDQGFAMLIAELKERGLLESTLIVWIGEFGRTPEFNANGGGRDHHMKGFAATLAGGGIRGGQVVGATDDDGAEITDRPLTPADLTATYCHLLDLSADKEYLAPGDRPLKIVDQGTVIKELV
jgi:uncharacterized protein (DUF1501 family)